MGDNRGVYQKIIQDKEGYEKTIRALHGNKTFFDTADFPWVKEVESRWPLIRKEIDRLMKCVELLPGMEEIQLAPGALTNDKRWKVFPIHAYGVNLEANERRCPETTRALALIPGMCSAMFSVLQSKKDIPYHVGPFAGVLRYHLGVTVPGQMQCGIQVGEDIRHWDEGKSLIFDDTHRHGAWNRSDEDRVILLVDFARPLPDDLAAINGQFISMVGQGEYVVAAAEQWGKWEAVHGVKLDQELANMEIAA